jgi:hypothetical protein
MFKVRSEIDILVIADDSKEAVQIAKQNISGETDYSTYKVFSVTQMTDIPDDWMNNIPYYRFGVNEIRKCPEILRSLGEVKNTKKEEAPVKELAKVTKKEVVVESETPILEEKNIPSQPPRPRGGPLPGNTRFGTMPGLKF